MVNRRGIAWGATTWLSVLVVIVATCWSVAAEAQRTYEDVFTEKAGRAYDEDPNVWVYQEEFRERFGMPVAWVDDGLEGAFAVAFRVVDAPLWTRGSEEGEAVRLQECRLELYLDADLPLPWVDDREADFRQTFTPVRFLRPQREMDQKAMARSVGLRVRGLVSGQPLIRLRGSGWESLPVVVESVKKRVYPAHPGRPAITLLSLAVGCGGVPESDVMVEFYAEDGDKVNLLHRVRLPPVFIAKIHHRWQEAYLAERDPSRGGLTGALPAESLEDPYVWVYTPEFAERFGMDKAYMDSDMKGIYAAAFRVEDVPIPIKFLAGNPKNSMPRRHCLLDVFLPDDSPLPWADRQEVNFWNGMDSLRFLVTQYPEYPWRKWETIGIPLAGVKSRRPMIFIRWGSRETDLKSVNIYRYARRIFYGIDYISFYTGCAPPRDDAAVIEFLEDAPWVSGFEYKEVAYRARLPKGFMERVYSVWIENEYGPSVQELSGVLNGRASVKSKVIRLPSGPDKYIDYGE